MLTQFDHFFLSRQESTFLYCGLDELPFGIKERRAHDLARCGVARRSRHIDNRPIRELGCLLRIGLVMTLAERRTRIEHHAGLLQR